MFCNYLRGKNLTTTLLRRSGTVVLFYFCRGLKFGFVTDLGFSPSDSPSLVLAKLDDSADLLSASVKEKVCPEGCLEFVQPGASERKQGFLLPSAG